MITLRQLGLFGVLGLILAVWAWGLGWVLNVDGLWLFGLFLISAIILFVGHYYRGMGWLRRNLSTRPTDSPVLREIASRAGLSREPRLFVTDSLEGANAFTVSFAQGDVIFVTPQIARTKPRIQAGILAHEAAHIKHNDSLITGFLSSFGQMMASVGQLWLLMIVAGPLGWVLLVFVWPVILAMHAWSVLTLMVYQPFVATLMRQREFQADEAAARWTSPEVVSRALEAIESYNRRSFRRLLRGSAGPLSTHPPTEERIRRLREGMS